MFITNLSLRMVQPSAGIFCLYLNWKTPMGKQLIDLCGALLLILHAVLVTAAEPVLPPTIKKHVDKRELAGAVMLVVDRDKVLFQQAVGFADIKNKRAMS